MERQILKYVELFPSLTIDDVLSVFNYSHKDYRKWLKKNKQPLYDVTPGLAAELYYEYSDPTSGQSCAQLAWAYNLTLTEVHKCLYTDVRDHSTCFEEVKKMLVAGKLTQESIAHTLGVSQGRVSQINKALGLGRSNKKRKQLSTQEKKEILLRHQAGDRILQLAEEYNVSRSQIYNTLREQV